MSLLRRMGNFKSICVDLGIHLKVLLKYALFYSAISCSHLLESQEMSQSHTTDQPLAPRGRVKEQ